MALLWAMALSESNPGGFDCSTNPQHGYAASFVLSAALAAAGALTALATHGIRYARAAAVGTSATAFVVLVGTLGYTTFADPNC